jgi:3-deoxy-7-phosphoheptulonate synthase
MPVGFKNGTGGSKKLAADAVLSAQYPHCFMGITNEGQAAICWTRGNHHCHIILRGGSKGPNYSSEDIEEAKELLRKNKVAENIMIDCSHGNSCKDYRNQPKVLREIIAKDRENIMGIMLESNLKEGNQKLIPGEKPVYGISITDSCMSIETTDELLMEIANKLS